MPQPFRNLPDLCSNVGSTQSCLCVLQCFGTSHCEPYVELSSKSLDLEFRESG